MNNSTLHFSPSQENKLNNLLHLENTIRKSSRSKLDTLNQLIFYDNCYDEVRPSQARLGSRANRRRETVNRNIAYWERVGVISKKNNGFKKCNTYYLNPLFQDFSFRKILRNILSNLWWFHKSLLYSKASKQEVIHRSVTLINNKLFIKRVVSGLPVSGSTLPGYTPNPNTSRKKEESNKMLNEIGQALNLTEVGKKKLSIFSEVVLEAVFGEFKRASAIQKPFVWFFERCKRESDRIGSRPSWSKFYALKDELSPEEWNSEWVSTSSSNSTRPEQLKENERKCKIAFLEGKIKQFRKYNPSAVAKDEMQLQNLQKGNEESDEPMAVWDVANEVFTCMEEEHVAKLAKLLGKETAGNVRDVCVRHLLNREYVSDGSERAMLAEKYLEKVKRQIYENEVYNTGRSGTSSASTSKYQ